VASISVVIPVRDGAGTIRECLEGLRASGGYAELLVIDDASRDETTAIAENAGARVIRCEKRIGPAGARNRGARLATGDVVLFVDSDVVVPPEIGAKLHEAFADPSVAAVQTIYTADCPAANVFSRYQNLYYHYSFARIREKRIAAFATWCAAIRREAFLALGGFNDRIPDPTVEDEELGYALVDAGLSILLDKSLQVRHLAFYSLSAFAGRRFRMSRAQSKSAWRSVKNRLLLRYMNLRETGTHHSRLVVMAILALIAGQAALGLALLLPVGGTLSWISTSVAMLSIPAALLCNSGFLKVSVNSIGIKSLPAFAGLCVFDMIVLGWGIMFGSIEYLLGSRY
jgi:glycosyltransferase involved in cell wall biosynthesis